MSGRSVLQVIRPAGGGMLAHVRLLVEGLCRRDFGVAVACPGTGGVREVLEGTGVPVYPLHLAGEMSPAADLADVLRLAAVLRERSFGLVHAHGLKAALVSLAAARLAGRVHTVYTAHGAPPALDGSLVYLRQKAAGLVVRRYDCLVAVSRHTRRALAAALSLDPALVQVIYNGVEVPRYLPPPRGPLPGSGPLVGMVARLAPRKGVEVFLRAARLILQECPRARFLVAGDGPLWPELEKLAGECGLAGHLVFTGRLSDAAGPMSFLDVFVLPCREEGGLPLVLLEAMARARPVVAGCTGGVPEVLSEGTGILVPPGDAGVLAGQVVRLLNDPQLAEKLGRAARQRVLDRFGAVRMQEETAALYGRVLAGELPARGQTALERVPGA